MSKRLLIIAGSYLQAREYVLKNKLKMHEHTIVLRVEQLQGVAFGSNYVKIGMIGEAFNIGALHEEIKRKQLVEIKP